MGVVSVGYEVSPSAESEGQWLRAGERTGGVKCLSQEESSYSLGEHRSDSSEGRPGSTHEGLAPAAHRKSGPAQKQQLAKPLCQGTGGSGAQRVGGRPCR